MVRRATFSDAAAFGEATFCDAAGFRDVTFSGTAAFGDVTFSGTAGFRGVTFSGFAGFDGTTFSGFAGFDGRAFSGPTTFVQVDFGTETISFVSPKQWGPPAPAFDWDQDVSQKPANVEPQDWPPALAATS
ncbi:pentapeptide repeat-containing protein [Nocardia sp. NPDC003726]